MSVGYQVEDIQDYLNRLTEEQAKLLVRHCNRYGMNPIICAWYDDMEDFFSDWCDQVGYTRSEARARFKEGKAVGEFKQFSDGQIVRLCEGPIARLDN